MCPTVVAAECTTARWRSLQRGYLSSVLRNSNLGILSARTQCNARAFPIKLRPAIGDAKKLQLQLWLWPHFVPPTIMGDASVSEHLLPAEKYATSATPSKLTFENGRGAPGVRRPLAQKLAHRDLQQNHGQAD